MKATFMKKTLALWLTIHLLLAALYPVAAFASDLKTDSLALSNLEGESTRAAQQIELRTWMDKAAGWIYKNRNFKVQNNFNDWDIAALSRAGYDLPEDYYPVLESYIVSKNGIFNVATDVERMVIGITAAGQDPANIAGFNFIEGIYNHANITSQPANAATYALIALDLKKSPVPDDALWTREKLVTRLLSFQQVDGSFSRDVDITAMALQALSNYMDDDLVKTSVGRAIAWLSTAQQANGGFKSWGSESSESISQVIIALTSLGLDPLDPQFVKPNGNMAEALIRFFAEDDGIKHTLDGRSNYMATHQGLMALSAYDRFLNGENKLYDMTDILPIQEPSTPEEEAEPPTIRERINKAGEWILTNRNFKQQDNFNDWDAVALSRAGIKVPDDYYPVLESYIVGKKGSFRNATDVERMVIGITATGFDPENIAGYNFIAGVYNHDRLDKQAANATTYALIALDLKNSFVPDDALWTRDKLIERLLSYQQEDGGFALSSAGDVDTTAMALQALSNYISRDEVKSAAESAVEWLSKAQTSNGGFEFGNVESSESSAQVIIALTSLGIDPLDERFVKKEGNVLDALIKHISSDGGFEHIVGQQSNYIATHQGLMALSAYERFLNGQNKLYDMTDITEPEEPQESVLNVTEQYANLDLDAEQIGTKLVLNIGNNVETLNITLPQDNNSPVYIRPLSTTLPAIEVNYGTIGLNMPPVEVLSEDWNGKLLLPVKAVLDLEPIKEQIEKQSGTAKVNEIKTAIRVGGSSPINFNETVTLTFKGQEKLLAGYVDSAGKFHNIPKGPGSSLNEYAYAENGNLIVKTNHFTDFITYSLKDIPSEPGPGTPSPGGGNGGSSASVKLSIEKISIGQGYITEPVNVSLQTGDTAFTLMKRYASEKGVSVSSIGSGESLYVQGIDGLYEFDHGLYSGWMYSVNDIYPSHSAGTKYLRDGDILRWRYTKDLGKDIGGYDSVIGPQNKEALKKKINELKGLTESDYTASSWSELLRVISLAEKAVNESDDQSLELVKLLKELSAAQKKLVLVKNNGTEEKPNPSKPDIKTQLPEKIIETINKSADWILKNTDFGTYDPFHDWDVMALVRSGKVVPAIYLTTLENYVREVEGKFRKVTDYERTVMAVAAIGKDPSSIAGYDFLEKIYNNERMTAQGSNGVIYALIALDASGVIIPSNAKWDRERLVDWLLTQQNEDGGFPLSKEQDGDSDVDVTAMALQALAGYQQQDKVKQATDKALEWLSKQQLQNGGMNAWGKENSESVSQVIIALSALGIPLDDKRFVKEKGNLYSNLLGFVNADGGIAHNVGGDSNYMATHQGLLGLLAHKRFLQKEKALYDFSDIRKTGTGGEGQPDTSKAFKDETGISTWAVDAVRKAAAAGFVQGTGASAQFMPQHEMTRAEFAAVLVRYLGLKIEEQADSVYTDVMKGRWYTGSIVAAGKAGIVTGSGTGAFRPDEAITREEMAVMLGRALGFADARQTNAKLPADLLKVSPWAAPAVTYLYEAGIMAGENGAFNPAGHVSRELAVFILMQFYQSDQQAA